MAAGAVAALALGGCGVAATPSAISGGPAVGPAPTPGPAPTTTSVPVPASVTTVTTVTGAGATGSTTGAAVTAPAVGGGRAADLGRYPVATDTLTIVDPSRPTVSRGRTVATTRTLSTVVWKPATPGRWPLIVFAHGFGVGPDPYGALLRAWASAGYVVAAPRFPLTDSSVAGPGLDENDINQQPADVRVVLDTLAAASTPLSADIDTQRVVLAGHSDGAETVLDESTVPALAGQPVVRAVVAMSVAALPGRATTANPPILITQGDADTINPPSEGQKAFAAATGPRFYMDLLGGGHLPPLQDPSRWLAAIEATTTTFFHLYGSGAAGVDPQPLLRSGNVATVATLTAG